MAVFSVNLVFKEELNLMLEIYYNIDNLELTAWYWKWEGTNVNQTGVKEGKYPFYQTMKVKKVLTTPDNDRVTTMAFPNNLRTTVDLSRDTPLKGLICTHFPLLPALFSRIFILALLNFWLRSFPGKQNSLKNVNF